MTTKEQIESLESNLLSAPTDCRGFARSCTNWKQFGSSRKITEERGLTYEQARERCREFNENLTSAQIRKGTRLEFTAEN